jgi:hypothetical protein
MMEKAEGGGRKIEVRILYKILLGNTIREGLRDRRKHTILHRER